MPIWKKKKVQLGGLAALLLLGGGGYFGYKTFFDQPPPPPPPPVVKKNAAPTAPAPAQPSPTATASAPATPSETLNKLAHAPANAINKAKGALDARQAGGQSDVDAALGGDAVANKAATGATKSSPPQRVITGAATQIAPGLTATTPLEAAPDAGPAFRAFISTAKVVSVIGGAKPMATINNRVVRPGEPVDAGLGIVLEAIETDTRQLVFKDRSGAIVYRRY